ncbi:hypothetical protein PSI15_16835 [Xenorhabdus sp. PR6a]|uniref:hypothetical protein n=1 Tax=Xenorhabdus sp. PR6a TaxID=3025877 RepID=UPI00235871EC|nr:hypothetical protein [Xenorhabdus sp. PR6a]MDC9583197.1 hypothetical protein [Xenorhabdus sp. PR6a]
MINKTKVVQFRATPKSHEKLEQLKARLKEKGVKPSIELMLNTILENMTLADFDKSTKALVEANSVKTRLLKMFKDGRITQEMLDTLLKNAESNEVN